MQLCGSFGWSAIRELSRIKIQISWATVVCDIWLILWSWLKYEPLASGLSRHYFMANWAMYHLYFQWKEVLKIQKFRRVVSYAGFYCFVSAMSYWYTNNTTRAGTSRGDQFYASFPAGTELLADTAKLYKAALGNCFEIEEWGPIEYSIMAKHFDRQGKPPFAYHSQYMAHLLSHGQLDGTGA